MMTSARDDAGRGAERTSEDRELFLRHGAGDAAARELLVERFLPLARQLARRYQRAGEPLDDLMQVASMGLIKAIDRFDPSREIAFSSYAVPTILGEIKRHFRDRTWAVRVPRDLQELTLRVDKAVGELSEELRRQPSIAEIGESVGADEEHVLEALQAGGAYRAVSFDAPRGTGGEDEVATLSDTIGVQEEGFDRAEERATLANLLTTVTPREREVLRMRFEEDMTQAEIGEVIGGQPDAGLARHPPGADAAARRGRGGRRGGAGPRTRLRSCEAGHEPGAMAPMPRDDESENERLDRELDQLLQELRVAMPGVQVLFAFLLAVPFQQRFAMVTEFQRDVYFATLLASAVASALFIAPTAYHRMMFRGHDKPRLVRISSRLALAGLVALAVAMNGAILLVTDLLFKQATVVVTIVATSLLFVMLWFVLGFVRRLSNDRSRDP